MSLIYNGINVKKINFGTTAVRKVIYGSTQVWSAGNTVTYVVDTGTTYQEEVDYEASCLSPKTFTPAKSGWTFVGWREDTAASASVLSSKVMGDNPVTLYAVFRLAVTVTYYNASTTAGAASGYRYYNNGSVVNPSFTFIQDPISSWTARGWSTSTAGNGAITYSNGVTVAIDSNITLYGMYQQTVTVTYYNGSTTASAASGIRYYNSNGSVVNPTFTLTQAAISGWTARGWSTGAAGNSSITYNNSTAFIRDSNITLYGMYQQTITLTTVANGTTSTQSGIRYYNSNSNTINPAFTVAAPTLTGATFLGWSASASSTSIANSSISALTLTASTTRYAVWSTAAQTIVSSYTKQGSYSYSAADSNSNIGFYGWSGKPLYGQLGGNSSTAGSYVDFTFSPAVVCGGQTVTLTFMLKMENTSAGNNFEGRGLYGYIIAGGKSASGSMLAGYYQCTSASQEWPVNVTLSLPNDGTSTNIVVRLQLQSTWILVCGIKELTVSAATFVK